MGGGQRGHEKLCARQNYERSKQKRGKKSNQKPTERKSWGWGEREEGMEYMFREKLNCKKDKFPVAYENGTDI